MTISDVLVAEIATYAIVFCRVGAAMMFMPGFGDSTVNVRARLLLALGLALAIGGSTGAPEALTSGFWPAVAAIFGEATVGVFIGLAGRLAIASLQVAGTIIATQISLANALSFDAISAQQGALPSYPGASSNCDDSS